MKYAASTGACSGREPAAQVCTVFAQLTVRGKWEGPHVFVVRIRGDHGEPVPGVRILDNGPKAGLQGAQAPRETGAQALWCLMQAV